ncbi:unnamed protein product [Candidula unifasciata]|uniref:G-protein coupled receptors family 1 profile domain-containing protein n=1 Tax=Candidula unifasciata TaxID=100452 RepID=A0A8S3ZWT4_9EUPU|nr:unnamed protein product [Candidula unifasciata]
MTLLRTHENRTNVLVKTESSLSPANVGAQRDITEEALQVFNKYISTVLLTVLSPVGLVTNILNIIVYWNQGIKDNANITFLALSFWDLMHCFLLFLSEICFVLNILFPQASVYIKPVTFQLVFLGHTRGCMYVLSTLVTVYLSVERSICIALPFRVKDIFTTPRVVLINLLIAVFGFACFSPAWATQGIHWVYDPRSNTTLLQLWISVNRRDVDLFVDTLNGIVTPSVAQILISVSGWFMIQGINRSNKLRQNQTSVSKSLNVFTLNDQLHKTLSSRIKFTRDKTVTNKDIKLTKVVVSLAAIFFTCNLPVVVVAVLRAMIADIDIGKRLFSWYKALYGIVYFCGVINCSVNIFVYYNVSSKYRREFVALFCRMKIRNKIL